MAPLRRLRPVLAIAVALVLLASGCGGDDKAKPASGDDKAKVAGGPDDGDDTADREDADDDLPSDDDIEEYVKALADRDPDALEEALDLTEPGSVAEASLLHTTAVLQAALAAGYSGEDLAADDIDDIDGGWRICDNGPDDCNDLTDFEGRGGKIVNYLVDGEEITDRLILGTGEAVPAGDLGTVTLRSAAEQAGENTLVVVVDVTSGDASISIAGYNASYRGEDGRQYSVGNTLGADDLGPDSTTTVALQFETAKVGGDVTIELQDEDYDSQTVTLPVR